MAAALVVAAEVAATLSATAAHRANAHHIRSVQARVTPTPYGGEPHLSLDSHIPSGPRIAAVRFVRDYALWRSDRLATIPATDATLRVIRLLERERRSAGVATDVAMRSVRIASAEGQRYVVTSAVGNFLDRHEKIAMAGRLASGHLNQSHSSGAGTLQASNARVSRIRVGCIARGEPCLRVREGICR